MSISATRPRRLVPLVSVCTALIISLLAGCSPTTTPDSGDSSNDSSEVTVWSWRVEDEAAYNDVFAQYAALPEGSPVDFRVFSTKDNDWATLLSTGLAGADGPDVTQMLSYSGQDNYVAAAQIEELDAGLIPGLDQNFSETALEGASVDDVIYGVPLMQVAMQIFYNKAIFDELGLEVPTTWEQFIGVNDALLGAGIIPMAVGGKDTWLLPQQFNILVGSRYDAASFVSDYEEGLRDFTDVSFVEALRQFGELAPYMPDNIAGVGYSDTQSLFINGSAAMFPGGSYELGYFQSQNPDLDLGVFSVPVTPDALAEGVVTYGFADSQFALSARAKDRDASLALLSHMATPEFGQAWSDATKQLSAVDGVTPNDPILRAITENYQSNPVADPFVTVFNAGNPSTSSVVGSGLSALLSGRSTPEEVATQIQAIVDTYKPFSPQG